jgi:hypothetical protein
MTLSGHQENVGRTLLLILSRVEGRDATGPLLTRGKSLRTCYP